MAQATIQISRVLLRHVWPEPPTNESIAKALLLPAAYKVVSIDDKFSNYDLISVVVESDIIPDGTHWLTPIYQVKYIECDGETVRREVTFGHMQMS